ncbi:MAG TPA: SurA N-terminal domain-containing protein [Candidatus Methylomirabilis sp.]|nr:SurA N-terminal domain-containing protein [Candidatus Methylomirabilis sp.]
MRFPRLSRLWTVIILSVFILASIGVTSVMLWGMYYRHWDSPFITNVSRAVPVPAARLGSRTVTYRAYLDSVRSVERYLQSDEAKNLGISRAMTDEDRKNALERLIREEALYELADARKAVLTDQQIQSAIGEFNSTGSSTQEIAEFLDKNFAWTIDDFTAHVIRPVLLTRLMTGSYAADHGNDPNALEKYLDERTQRTDVVRYVKF